MQMRGEGVTCPPISSIVSCARSRSSVHANERSAAARCASSRGVKQPLCSPCASDLNAQCPSPVIFITRNLDKKIKYKSLINIHCLTACADLPFRFLRANLGSSAAGWNTNMILVSSALHLSLPKRRHTSNAFVQLVFWCIL